MIDILFWISIFAGGLLVVMLVLSLVGGLDFDLDLDGGDTEVDNGGGVGLLKAALTFFSVGAWVFRMLLISQQSTTVSLLAGIATGIVAVYLMSQLLKWLLTQQEDNSWKIGETLYSIGRVYLKVPAAEGTGIVQILVNGALKDLKARTDEENDIATGSDVIVVAIEQDVLVVSSNLEIQR